MPETAMDITIQISDLSYIHEHIAPPGDGSDPTRHAGEGAWAWIA
ncbi:MAG: hypothetical protein ACE14P_15030 [Methanotrichaceae archaeon]